MPQLVPPLAQLVLGHIRSPNLHTGLCCNSCAESSPWPHRSTWAPMAFSTPIGNVVTEKTYAKNYRQPSGVHVGTHNRMGPDKITFHLSGGPGSAALVEHHTGALGQTLFLEPAEGINSILVTTTAPVRSFMVIQAARNPSTRITRLIDEPIVSCSSLLITTTKGKSLMVGRPAIMSYSYVCTWIDLTNFPTLCIVGCTIVKGMLETCTLAEETTGSRHSRIHTVTLVPLRTPQYSHHESERGG